MPEVNGIEALLKVCKFEKENNIKVSVKVLITANINQNYQLEEYKSKGIHQIIDKPLTFDKL